MSIARMLATDNAVGSDELEAAIRHMDERLRDCTLNDQPVPFSTYRNKVIFEATLRLRFSNAVSS